jgi:hypothetical protein
MRSTSPLKMLCAMGLPENHLNVHPNEGADLGLMMTRYSVDIGDGLRAELNLLNDCPKESIVLNPKFWEKLGKPAKAILSYDGVVLKIEKA